MCDKHPMPNERHGDMKPDTDWTQLALDMVRPICRVTMWGIWILLWALYCQLSVTNPEWQLLRSGEDRTMLAAWLAGSLVPDHIRRGWEELSHGARQRRQTLHNQQHHPKCQIYAYDVMCHAAMQPGFNSVKMYMREFIGLDLDGVLCTNC